MNLHKYFTLLLVRAVYTMAIRAHVAHQGTRAVATTVTPYTTQVGRAMQFHQSTPLAAGRHACTNKMASGEWKRRRQVSTSTKQEAETNVDVKRGSEEIYS